jgi:hypothetical protein
MQRTAKRILGLLAGLTLAISELPSLVVWF